MLRDRSIRLLAAGLCLVAGYVDAIGFLMTGGFFVSFMSGNTTRLGIGLAEGSGQAMVAAGLIGAFVAGAAIGATTGRLAGPWRRAAVILLVTGLLVGAATLSAVGLPAPAIALIVLAMGAENTIFAEDGEVHVGLTYMTGALVKLGKRLAAAVLGGPRLGWTPLLLLWASLLTGAVVGARAYGEVGAGALWGAALAMGLLGLAAIAIGPERRASPERRPM